MNRDALLEYLNQAISNLDSHIESVGHLGVEWPRLLRDLLCYARGVSPRKLDGIATEARALYWLSCLTSADAKPHDAPDAIWSKIRKSYDAKDDESWWLQIRLAVRESTQMRRTDES